MWAYIILATILTLPRLGFAGEIFAGEVNGLGCDLLKDTKICITAVFQGQIIPGDAARLERFTSRLKEMVETNLKQKVRIGKLHFDSPGGDLVESMKVGRFIRSNLIATQVTHDCSCSSACVVAFLGGAFRVPVGPIGIHSFYSREFIGPEDYEKASQNYNLMALEVESYLKEMRIPARFLDEMKMVPPNTLKTLNFDELKALGVIGIDPVYAQIRENNTPNAGVAPQ